MTTATNRCRSHAP